MQHGYVLRIFLGILKAKKAMAAANAFNAPLQDTLIHAGQTMVVSWIDPAGETVDVSLMKGDSASLQEVLKVAAEAENDGELPWKVPLDLAPGQYSLRITSDGAEPNYSPWFTVFDPVTPLQPEAKPTMYADGSGNTGFNTNSNKNTIPNRNVNSNGRASNRNMNNNRNARNRKVAANNRRMGSN